MRINQGIRTEVPEQRCCLLKMTGCHLNSMWLSGWQITPFTLCVYLYLAPSRKATLNQDTCLSKGVKQPHVCVLWRVTRALFFFSQWLIAQSRRCTQTFFIPNTFWTGGLVELHVLCLPDTATVESRPCCWQLSWSTSPHARRLYHLPTVGPDVPTCSVILQRREKNEVKSSEN